MWPLLTGVLPPRAALCFAPAAALPVCAPLRLPHVWLLWSPSSFPPPLLCGPSRAGRGSLPPRRLAPLPRGSPRCGFAAVPPLPPLPFCALWLAAAPGCLCCSLPPKARSTALCFPGPPPTCLPYCSGTWLHALLPLPCPLALALVCCFLSPLSLDKCLSACP